MLIVVSIGKMSNLDPLHLIKLCGLNHLFRRGLLGLILEINLIIVLGHIMALIIFLSL